MNLSQRAQSLSGEFIVFDGDTSWKELQEAFFGPISYGSYSMMCVKPRQLHAGSTLSQDELDATDPDRLLSDVGSSSLRKSPPPSSSSSMEVVTADLNRTQSAVRGSGVESEEELYQGMPFVGNASGSDDVSPPLRDSSSADAQFLSSLSEIAKRHSRRAHSHSYVDGSSHRNGTSTSFVLPNRGV